MTEPAACSHQKTAPLSPAGRSLVSVKMALSEMVSPVTTQSSAVTRLAVAEVTTGPQTAAVWTPTSAPSQTHPAARRWFVKTAWAPSRACSLPPGKQKALQLHQLQFYQLHLNRQQRTPPPEAETDLPETDITNITTIKTTAQQHNSTTPQQHNSTPVRLVNSHDRCSGRVKVSNDGRWGTVCDDSWDLRAGNMVCRQLGCGAARSAPGSAAFGPGSGPIWLDDVNCLGNEASITDCRHRGFGVHNCGHHEDASVICERKSP